MLISWRGQVLRSAVAATLMCGAVHGHAAFISLDAGPDNWVTQAGRTVERVTGTGIPVPAMRACIGNDCDLDSAIFVMNPVIGAGAKVIGLFNIIGDDLVIFSTNGGFRFAAALDENPLPLEFGVQQYDLQLHSGTLISQGVLTGAFGAGLNHIRIDLYDGYFDATKPPDVVCSSTISIPGTTRQWCVTDRVNEHVHIEGGILAVPEPGMLALLSIGLTGFAATRRRQSVTKR